MTSSIPENHTPTEMSSRFVERKFSVREAASYLGVSKSFLDKSRITGTGPQFLKLAKRVVYDVNDLESWASSKRRRHTSI